MTYRYEEIFSRVMGIPTSSGSEKATWNDNLSLNENFVWEEQLEIDHNSTYIVTVTTDVEQVTLPINFAQQGTTKYTFKHNVDEDTTTVAAIQLEFPFDQQNLGTIFIRKRFFNFNNDDSFTITLQEYVEQPTPPQPTEDTKTCIVRFGENIACMVTLKDGEFSVEKLGGE